MTRIVQTSALVILFMGFADRSWCQTSAPPPPALPAPRPYEPPIISGPIPLPQPGPVTPAPYPVYPQPAGPFLVEEPPAEWGPLPGWFGAVELSFLSPHLKNRVSGTLDVAGFHTPSVSLPTADLDWSGSPRVELGYRFEHGLGEVIGAYRSFTSEGRATLFDFDLDGGPGFLQSRLDLDVFDVDYATSAYSFLPNWDMRWRVGGRLASVYFDSRAIGWFVEQQVSNRFVGFGPHVGLDLWRPLDVPGLGLFGRVEGAAVVGRIRQSFGGSVLLDDGLLFGAAATARQTQVVPVVSFQAGLGWEPPSWDRCVRFLLGYQFEQWWCLGNIGDSQAELTTQGIFFRAEFGF